MKEFLSRAGVALTVRNIEEDFDAYTELIALGVRTVPFTIIGTRHIRGFDADALRGAVEEAGA